MSRDGQSSLFPQPVLIIGTYDENGSPNAMNAALGGIVGMDEIIIDPMHYGYYRLGEKVGNAFQNGKQLK